MAQPQNRQWTPLSVREIATLLEGADFPWWICGGYAVDLFLGRETRTHADVEVGVLRCDAPTLFSRLAGFEAHLAKDGVLKEMRGDAAARTAVAPEAHGFWCRRRGETAWALEVLVNDGDRDTLVFRRDPRITRPLATALEHTPDGVPYLAPELQLLFKAKAVREKDQRDFDTLLPALGDERTGWLADAMRVAYPDHPWTEALRTAPN